MTTGPSSVQSHIENVARALGERRREALAAIETLRDLQDRERVTRMTIERTTREQPRFAGLKNEGERKIFLDAALLSDPLHAEVLRELRLAERERERAEVEMECARDAFRALQFTILARTDEGVAGAAIERAIEHVATQLSLLVQQGATKSIHVEHIAGVGP